MKVDINININLEELKEVLGNYDELRQFVTTSIEDLRCWVRDINEYGWNYKYPAEKPSKPQVQAAPVQGEEITMETIRAKLAALMDAGKQTEVKELLKEHGAEKLSDIPEENYPALLKDAEEV